MTGRRPGPTKELLAKLKVGELDNWSLVVSGLLTVLVGYDVPLPSFNLEASDATAVLLVLLVVAAVGHRLKVRLDALSDRLEALLDVALGDERVDS